MSEFPRCDGLGFEASLFGLLASEGNLTIGMVALFRVVVIMVMFLVIVMMPHVVMFILILVMMILVMVIVHLVIMFRRSMVMGVMTRRQHIGADPYTNEKYFSHCVDLLIITNFFRCK